MDVTKTAALLAVPTRMTMVYALAGGVALPASELAYRAGITPQTASHHLALMVQAELLVVERCLRYRYYRLANPTVVDAIENLLALSSLPPIRDRRDRTTIDRLHVARSCYDHLAGRIAVSLADALQEKEWIILQERDFHVTGAGEARFKDLGLDITALRQQQRHFARRCIDWSERRPHIGGALGAAMMARLQEMGWIKKKTGDRKVSVSSTGQTEFWKLFGIDTEL